MKTKIVFLIAGLIFMLCGYLSSQVIIQRVQLNGNNINAYFQNTRIFDQNTTSGNLAGFEWPKGSGKTAIFSTGLCIAGFITDSQGPKLAQSMASYKGEFAPGYIEGGIPIPITNQNFKLYKIKRGDNSNNNPDYANWPLMIPWGAPYIDVNNNGQYDPGVDSIGIRNAVQVIFICMTDGFAYSHSSGEGFGGGITYPLLFSQVAWTAWCYDRNDLMDMQFMKWTVINKDTTQWHSTYFSIVCDPDLGWANDDYIGCDTSKKLGFCYNATNNDQMYGANPPAVGMIMHKSPLGLTSFIYFGNTSTSPPPCETDPNGEAYPAYLMMQGYKKDSTSFLDPLQGGPAPLPYKKTKFVYPGDPATGLGWTELKGSIPNCNRDSTGTRVIPNPAGDRRFILSSGANDYTVNPGDTVTIYASQLIARGNSNLNSVTLLKNYANSAWEVYNGGFNVGIQKISSIIPSEFALYQNYPNPFNPISKIKFSLPSGFPLGALGNDRVLLKVFDILGKEVATLVNEQLQPGTYEVSFDGSNLSSGVYFYQLRAGDYIGTKKLILLK